MDKSTTRIEIAYVISIYGANASHRNVYARKNELGTALSSVVKDIEEGLVLRFDVTAALCRVRKMTHEEAETLGHEYEIEAVGGLK